MVFGLSDLGKLLCTNFKTLFGILTAENMPDDIPLQFPQSTAEFDIAPGQTWTYTSTVNRRLCSINVTATPGIIVELLKDNNVLMNFRGESGTITFRNGIKINEYTVRATNTSTETGEWRCRMIFF